VNAASTTRRDRAMARAKAASSPGVLGLLKSTSKAMTDAPAAVSRSTSAAWRDRGQGQPENSRRLDWSIATIEIGPS
jgi:hypothetical protein